MSEPSFNASPGIGRNRSARTSPSPIPLRRRAFLSGLSFSLALTGCRTTATAGSVRVLTYNTHHGEGTDGRLDLPRLAEVIRAARPDVVALQEVDDRARRTGDVSQWQTYAALTGWTARFGEAMPFQGGFYGQALLSRWPLEEFAVHRLPGPADQEPRIAVSARIRRPSGSSFRFVGLHLDASREDGSRWDQAHRLNELFAHGTEPTVMAGDFNATPDSRVMRVLFDHWTDAAAAHPEPTIPAESPRSRIDYVLLRPASVWRVQSVTVLPESVASDHRPLLVELS